MKKIFLLIASLFIMKAEAQITLEQTWNNRVRSNFNNPRVGKVTFTGFGEKFYSIRGSYYTTSDTISIFNYDGTIFKEFILPSGMYYSDFQLMPTGPHYDHYVQSISDNLFNNDTQVEVLARQVSKSTTPGGSQRSSSLYFIVNETGNIEYSFPDSVISYDTYFPPIIFKFSNNYKVAFYSNTSGISGNDFGTVKVYSLPGSIPCTTCDLGNGITEPGNTDNGFSEMKAYPNPFTGQLNIEYKLSSHDVGAYLTLTTIDGRELRRQSITKDTDTLLLETADLPKGMIVACIYGSNKELITKKLVKIE